MDLKHLVSRIEIAAQLGVQPQTIAHWERAGWTPMSCSAIRTIDTDPNPCVSRRAGEDLAVQELPRDRHCGQPGHQPWLGPGRQGVGPLNNTTPDGTEPIDHQ